MLKGKRLVIVKTLFRENTNSLPFLLRRTQHMKENIYPSFVCTYNNTQLLINMH